MADLSIKFAGIEFKNPMMAASGTETALTHNMIKCANAGVGAIVTKTCHAVPDFRPIQHSPSFYVYYPENVRQSKQYSFYGYEGGNQIPIEKYREEIRNALPTLKKNDCRLVANISGNTFEDFTESAKILEPVADMIEIMMQYPFQAEKKEIRYMPGHVPAGDPELAAEVVKRVKEVVNVPIMPKMSADEGDIRPVIKAMEREGVSAVNIAHRFRALEIDIETAVPITLPRIVGYSGSWLAPITRAWVAIAAESTKLPICGHGGLDNWRDCIATMMAGASTLQMCTAPMMRGYKFFTETISKMDMWLDSHGYSSVKDIVGITLRKMVLPINIPPRVRFLPKAQVVAEKCNGCRNCQDVCFYDAIDFDEETLKAVINQDKCVGCANCTQLCPTYAIRLMYREKEVPVSFPGAPGRIPENKRTTDKVESRSIVELWREFGLIPKE
jgi:dihydropyrimidine dehydrogenase (NAD+) subunit PreA